MSESQALSVREANMPAPMPPAGYDPSRLDQTIRGYLAVGEKSIRHAESLQTRIEKALERLATAPDADDALEEAATLVTLHDKLSKANLNLVKATDELTRLRSFLAGGPDSRADLTVMGELDLRALVVTAVKKLGLLCERCAANLES